MTKESYKVAFQDAKYELAEAIAELGKIQGREAALEVRIVELRQSVASLARLCGEKFVEEDELGLTDAIRLALKTAGTPVAAAGIRNRIESMGFDVSRHGNILASIHTVLKRLVDQGQAEDIGGLNYKWIAAKPATYFEKAKEAMEKSMPRK
ncbi:MAG TPA: hypothetical protein VFE08_09340 [Candidatus Sulfotelmatobacter sp.]|jgi:hypothetical protein|nr:hypothetical protein [Candidatus Sulfotelmatobacter sp.]